MAEPIVQLIDAQGPFAGLGLRDYRKSAAEQAVASGYARHPTPEEGGPEVEVAASGPEVRTGAPKKRAPKKAPKA